MDVSEQWLMIARLAFAAALGALIGLEREYRGNPAGIRTIALVCVGSALFAEESLLFPRGDTARIASNIVVGIGFVGAGVILREGMTIRGITTAATIWTSAAIGVAVSRDLFLVAGFVTLMVILLLEASPLTKRIAERGAESRNAAAYGPEAQ